MFVFDFVQRHTITFIVVVVVVEPLFGKGDGFVAMVTGIWI